MISDEAKKTAKAVLGVAILLFLAYVLAEFIVWDARHRGAHQPAQEEVNVEDPGPGPVIGHMESLGLPGSGYNVRLTHEGQEILDRLVSAMEALAENSRDQEWEDLE